MACSSSYFYHFFCLDCLQAAFFVLSLSLSLPLFLPSLSICHLYPSSHATFVFISSPCHPQTLTVAFTFFVSWLSSDCLHRFPFIHISNIRLHCDVFHRSICTRCLFSFGFHLCAFAFPCFGSYSIQNRRASFAHRTRVVCHLLWLVGSLIIKCSVRVSAVHSPTVDSIFLQLLYVPTYLYRFFFSICAVGVCSDTASMAWWRRRMLFGRIRRYRRWASPRSGICWRWSVAMWRAHGGKACFQYYCYCAIIAETIAIVECTTRLSSCWQFVMFFRAAHCAASTLSIDVYRLWNGVLGDLLDCVCVRLNCVQCICGTISFRIESCYRWMCLCARVHISLESENMKYPRTHKCIAPKWWLYCLSHNRT